VYHTWDRFSSTSRNRAVRAPPHSTTPAGPAPPLDRPFRTTVTHHPTCAGSTGYPPAARVFLRRWTDGVVLWDTGGTALPVRRHLLRHLPSYHYILLPPPATCQDWRRIRVYLHLPHGRIRCRRSYCTISLSNFSFFWVLPSHPVYHFRATWTHAHTKPTHHGTTPLFFLRTYPPGVLPSHFACMPRLTVADLPAPTLPYTPGPSNARDITYLAMISTPTGLFAANGYITGCVNIIISLPVDRCLVTFWFVPGADRHLPRCRSTPRLSVDCRLTLPYYPVRFHTSSGCIPTRTVLSSPLRGSTFH